jgi:hypothetical protein
MERRRFLSSALAASAALGSEAAVAAQANSGTGSPEFYVLRHYHLTSGPQRKLADEYLKNALVPALNRLGIAPVGAFSVEIGPQSPSVYVLMPSTALETLVTVDLRLAKDDEYNKAGAEFLKAPAKEPAYVRVENSLMRAFEGKPKLSKPPATDNPKARVFELRTYESPSDEDHRLKVEMFHSGEFDIFQRAGFWQIFYGDTMVGPNQPNLTYMLGFANIGERTAKWDAFRDDPQWKKLTVSQRFSFENIVSNVTNLILAPTAYSQI